MQKAVRLNILTRNNTAKQSKKVLERKTKEEWKEWHQHTNRQKAIQVEHEAEERLTRRQDWMAGPLAPNRNSGLQKGIYGTIELGLGTLPDVPKSVRAGPKTKGYAVTTDDEKDRFKGTTIVGNVVENDRVVIVAGPERLRGLIGTVNHVDMEKEEVKLRNVNTVSSLQLCLSTTDPARQTSVSRSLHRSAHALVNIDVCQTLKTNAPL